MARVELRGLAKRYRGGVEALADLDLTIEEGEFLVIVGPSGSGKSTLLRIIAGLDEPTAGEVWIGGRRVDGWPPHRRDVGMVFQTPALYPHLSAFDNLAFGLRPLRLGREALARRVEATAAQLGLTGLLDRPPRAMSGGQRQRVALGRVLVRRPGVILLDEPLSNLDAPLRVATRSDLIDVHRATGSTMVLVTHDQAEALALGHRIAVLADGRVVQVGTPEEVYLRPASRFVARFLGTPPMNLLPCVGRVENGALLLQFLGLDEASPLTVTLDEATAPAWLRSGSGLEMGLRAEDLHPASGSHSAGPVVVGEVLRVEPMGHETLATLRAGPAIELQVRLPGMNPARVGDRLPVRFDLTRAVWFDPASGHRLADG